MARFQMSLNVSDAEAAVSFYTKLLGVAPAKQRPGYANFVVQDPPMKLVLIEEEGEPGTINHVGIEYADGAAVASETERVTEAGLEVVVDDPHTCCFATQEKAWARDLDGVPWELYTVVADTADFGANPHAQVAVDEILPAVELPELVDALADPAVLVVDAQGDGGFAKAHIPGASNFRLEDVVGQAHEATAGKDHPILLYCTDHDCLGSEFVGTQLVDAGYSNVKRFPGGVKEWADSGFTTETSP